MIQYTFLFFPQASSPLPPTEPPGVRRNRPLKTPDFRPEAQTATCARLRPVRVR